MDNPNVYTIMHCCNCERNSVITSTNTWNPNVRNKPETGSWIYLTLVYCYRCVENGMLAYVGLRMPAINANVPDAAWSVVEYLNRFVDMPVILNVSAPVHMHANLHQNAYEDPNQYLIVVESVDTVMCGMWGLYTLNSVVNKALINPHEDFISLGPAVSMELLMYPSQMTVNNIVFCPSCWRNVVLTGEVSIMNVNDFEVRGRHLNLVMYTQCARCADAADDSETRVTRVEKAMYMNEAKVAGMIAYVSKIMGNDVCIYRDPNTNNCKVVDAYVMKQRLMFQTKIWSLVNDEMKPENEYFF